MAFALVRPRAMTMSELRRALPATNLAKMMITGALTGVLPRYNDRGEEDGPADPLSAAQRIDLADKLMKKILPDLKTDEPVEQRPVDAELLAANPDSVKRLTTAQIRAAIEADFAAQAAPILKEPEHVQPTPQPADPARPPDNPPQPKRRRGRPLVDG